MGTSAGDLSGLVTLFSAEVAPKAVEQRHYRSQDSPDHEHNGDDSNDPDKASPHAVGPVCEAARSDPKYQGSNTSNHNTSNQNLVSFSCLIRQPDMLHRSNWNSDLGIQSGRCGTRTHDLSRVKAAL